MDNLNFEEKLIRYIHGRFQNIVWNLLKWRGLEFPPGVEFGDDLRLPHGSQGTVIHERTVIGNRVRIFQGVTIGRADQYLNRDQVLPGGRVVIGNDVTIGAGSVILFKSGQTTHIGNWAVIGANAVVTCSVPAGEIWAGQPANCVSHNPNFPDAF